MIDPVISIYSSAIRTSLWLSLHRSLSTNKVPFEMIFVGPKEPTFELPNNFRYIHSNVKPAQCYYIASYHCQGEYLIYMNDDFVLSEGLLDNLIESYTENSIVSACYSYHSRPQTFSGKDGDPVQPVGTLVHRSLWNKLAIDSNYVAAYLECDMAMQARALGARVIMSKKSHIRENKGPNLCLQKKQFGDRRLFYSAWFETWSDYRCILGEPLSERRFPVVPFVWTDDILTVSQGKTNMRWK